MRLKNVVYFLLQICLLFDGSATLRTMILLGKFYYFNSLEKISPCMAFGHFYAVDMIVNLSMISINNIFVSHMLKKAKIQTPKRIFEWNLYQVLLSPLTEIVSLSVYLSCLVWISLLAILHSLGIPIVCFHLSQQRKEQNTCKLHSIQRFLYVCMSHAIVHSSIYRTKENTFVQELPRRILLSLVKVRSKLVVKLLQ